MAAKKYLDIIERIDRSIHFECTGNPCEFSKKLAISERSLYYYLSEMRDNGAPIIYSRNMATYRYKGDGRFLLQFRYAG